MELLELLELEDAEEDALLEPALLGGILKVQSFKRFLVKIRVCFYF